MKNDVQVAEKYEYVAELEESLRQCRDVLKRRDEECALLRVENESLLKDNVEWEQTDKALRSSLREKETLLKEIYHRVKNNLQIVLSLLNLQSEYFTDERVIEVFRDIRDRIVSMALVHEKLYRSESLSRVGLGEYVRNFVDHLFWSYRADSDAVLLKVGISDDVSLDVDRAIPCGLIINELVSNALKYAFPEGRKGEVRVGFHESEGKGTLIVSDNGVGFPEDIDFRDTESLGFQLVTNLTDQLGGTVELDREGGTRFEIVF